MCKVAYQEHTLSIFNVYLLLRFDDLHYAILHLYKAMICSPQRNSLKPEHFETLFLLATLKILVKESHDYSKEMELSKNS